MAESKNMDKKIQKNYEIDMCNGPLFGKILLFTLPLMLSGILQLLFNAADVVVVGRFAGNESLAAVGSTGALTNLLVNMFIGLSVGANVLVARYYGAKRDDEVSQTVHTSMIISVVGGIILALIGFVAAKPLLVLMDTPEDVIGLVLGNGAYLFGNQILSLYSTDARVIEYGIGRMAVICTFYCLCGMMDVLGGSIRGLGYAVMPMIVSLLGACVFRVVWIYTIFQWDRSLHTLYISYPISWAVTALAHLICFMIVRKKLESKY